MLQLIKKADEPDGEDQNIGPQYDSFTREGFNSFMEYVDALLTDVEEWSQYIVSDGVPSRGKGVEQPPLVLPFSEWRNDMQLFYLGPPPLNYTKR